MNLWYLAGCVFQVLAALASYSKGELGWGLLSTAAAVILACCLVIDPRDDDDDS